MLISDEFEWDYHTFESHVEGMCAQIAKHPSQRVPFLAFQTPLSAISLFASWKLGKIACPLNPKNPKNWIMAALIELGSPLFTPSPPSPATPIHTPWDLDKLATFLYTSGSTGKAKIACHTLKNHVLSAQGSLAKIPLNAHHVWALTLPLYHVGGIAILFRTYLVHAKVLLSQSWQKATHLSLVPTQLFRLMRDKVECPCLQTILLGGAPIPSLQTPWNTLSTYGMTEMSSQIITDHSLHPHAEMILSSDQEILARGGVLFQGYLQENGTISCPVDASGWFPTNDLGRWEGPRFHIIGRKDNLFISGGENIQPEEIEAAIRLHCHQEEVVVVPIKDQEYGARPVVFLQDPSILTTVQAKLQHVLPKFKIPIRAFPLPQGNGLKLSRQYLQTLIGKKSQD